MAALRFTRRAEADLLSVGDYTLRTWGETQAIRYLDDLEACGRRLADNAMLGQACNDVRPGLRRMACGRHVIFYRQDSEGILVSRILHLRILPERHDVE